MRYKSKIVSCLLVICLLISSLYIDRISVSAAGSSKTKVRLRIDNRNVSGKTVSIKKGKKKKIRVFFPKKKKVRITFRSNKSSIAAVSKAGKITAKGIGTAKITVTVKSKNRKCKGWVKVKVVSVNRKSDVPLPIKTPVSSPTITPAVTADVPTVTPSETPTIVPSDTAQVVPSVIPTTEPAESPAPDTGAVSDMYKITIRVNGKDFPAKLYQTETTKSIMQKLPLTITMTELNGNEKFYYFSESFPTETENISMIHAGDLKLYGSSCLVLFYETFSTSYRYTSLGYVENPEGLAEALGTGSVHVDVFGSE